MAWVPHVTGEAARPRPVLPGPPAWIWAVAAAGLFGVGIAAVIVAFAGPEITVMIAASVAAVAAAYAMPGFLFAAYLLVPFYKGAIQPYLPVDVTVLLAAANALQVIPVILDSRARRVPRAGLLLWLGVGGLVLLGTLYARDQTLALSTAVSFWALVIAPLLAAGLRVSADDRFIRQLLWTFFALGALTTVLGGISLSSSDRLVVLGMNTIQMGRVVLLVPLVGITFAFARGSWLVRAATVVLIPISVIVSLASGSRGPLLVLAILAVIGAARNLLAGRIVRPQTLLTLAAVAVATVVVLAAASSLLPAQSLQRFTLFGDFIGSVFSGDAPSTTGDTSSAARVQLFGLAVSMFTDHPVLGTGTAGFAALSPIYAGPLLGDRYPHNALLQFAAEFGLVGVGAFVGLVILAYRRATPKNATWAALRVLFLYFLLNSMVSGNILEDRTMWGLLMLLLLADVASADARGSELSRPARGPKAPPLATEGSPHRRVP